MVNRKACKHNDWELNIQMITACRSIFQLTYHKWELNSTFVCCTPGNSGVNSSETKYINKYRIHLLMLLIFKLQNLRTSLFQNITKKTPRMERV